MLEIASWSGRDHMSLAQANRFRVPLSGMVSYLSDVYAGGNPSVTPGFRWSGNSWEVSAYFGILAPVIVLLMAVPSMFVKHSLRRLVFVSILLCAFGWWLSLGVQGGLYPIVFRFVPGAKAFHDPARFLHFVHIGVPLVIGGVLSSLETSSGGRIIGTVLGLVNIASLLLVAPSWYPLVPSQVWLDAQEFYKPMESSVVYTQSDRSVWLTYANPKSFSGVQTDKQVRDFLMSGIPNIPGTWGVVSVGGYEPVAPKSSMSMQGWTGAKPIENVDVLADLGVTQLIQGSGVVTDLPKHRQSRVTTVSRVINGWSVSTNGDSSPLQLKVMRNAGWEIERGGDLHRIQGGKPGSLLLSGTGRLKYHPASFRLGLFFTLVALGILAGITLHTVQNARKV